MPLAQQSPTQHNRIMQKLCLIDSLNATRKHLCAVGVDAESNQLCVKRNVHMQCAQTAIADTLTAMLVLASNNKLLLLGQHRVISQHTGLPSSAGLPENCDAGSVY